MHITTIATLLSVAVFAPAFAQSPAGAQHAYGLDPYNPRDAEILRNYASVLVAQTPISELRKLDPYNPTHAALLRSMGGGIPLWAPWYLPGPVPASSMPFQTMSASGSVPHVVVLLVDERAQAEPQASAPAAAPAPASPGAVATLRRPESNDGVWIRHEGQTWISGGAAVPFEESQFTRVGDYGNFPVYRSRAGGDDIIYVPARADLVAPYRLKR